MNTFMEKFLNWWVSRPSNISFGGESVSILPQHWMEISYVLFFILTIIPIIISILFCYTVTNIMGKQFIHRWWLLLIITSIVNFALIFFYLKVQIFTVGFDETLVSFGIPISVILNRALVGLLQTFIWYYLISIIIVKLLGGIMKFSKFKTNLNYPFPKLF